MKRYLFCIMMTLLTLSGKALNLYSIATGVGPHVWSDGNNWSTVIGGSPYGGTLNANDNYTFFIRNGNNFDFSGYDPDGWVGNNFIYIDNGVLSSVSFDNSNVGVCLSKNGSITVTNNFNSGLIYYYGSSPALSTSIVVGGIFNTNNFYSNGSDPKFSISAQSINITDYNYYPVVGYQRNLFNTSFNITNPTGSVAISNYYDKENSTLTINGGDLTITNVPDYIVKGDITVSNGDLSIAAGVWHDVDINSDISVTNGNLTMNTIDDLIGDISIENGDLATHFLKTVSGDINIKGDLTVNLWDTTIVNNLGSITISDGNFTTNSLLTLNTGADVSINEGSFTGKNVTTAQNSYFTLVNADYKSWNTTISGQFTVKDGDVILDGGGVSFTVNPTGKVYIFDKDNSGDGNILRTGGGSHIINNGILYAEEVIVSAGVTGCGVVNNEVMFIKEYSANSDVNNNPFTNANDAITSGYGSELTGGPYTGSYLLYCSGGGSVANITNNGTAFYTDGESSFPSAGTGAKVKYFATSAECAAAFYREISVALPISLLTMDAISVPSGVEITWQTVSENNNDYFSLWRSTSGFDFKTIGTVKGAGTSSTVKAYKYIDENPEKGINYYRISQTDFDGKTEIFPIMSVYNIDNNKFTVFPTIVKIGVDITIQTDSRLDYEVELYSNSGVLLQRKKCVEEKEILPISDELQPGQYYLKLNFRDEHLVQPIMVIK